MQFSWSVRAAQTTLAIAYSTFQAKFGPFLPPNTSKPILSTDTRPRITKDPPVIISLIHPRHRRGPSLVATAAISESRTHTTVAGPDLDTRPHESGRLPVPSYACHHRSLPRPWDAVKALPRPHTLPLARLVVPSEVLHHGLRCGPYLRARRQAGGAAARTGRCPTNFPDSLLSLFCGCDLVRLSEVCRSSRILDRITVVKRNLRLWYLIWRIFFLFFKNVSGPIFH
jgi:hypothetical protein